MTLTLTPTPTLTLSLTLTLTLTRRRSAGRAAAQRARGRGALPAQRRGGRARFAPAPPRPPPPSPPQQQRRRRQQQQARPVGEVGLAWGSQQQQRRRQGRAVASEAGSAPCHGHTSGAERQLASVPTLRPPSLTQAAFTRWSVPPCLRRRASRWPARSCGCGQGRSGAAGRRACARAAPAPAPSHARRGVRQRRGLARRW